MAGYIGAKAVGLNVTTGDILGDVGVGGDVSVGDDLSLTSDSAVLNIGADNDLKITHNGTNGDFESAGDLTFDVAGDIILDADGGDVRFKDAGTEFLQIFNNSTNVHIYNPVQDKDILIQGNDGGSTVTAMTIDMSAAGQVNFNAGLGIGGTGAANTLNDYEEGTFTPTLAFATAGNSSFGYAAQVGHYVKVGDTVHIQLNIRLNAFTKGTGSGQVLVANLPYTAFNTSGYAIAGLIIRLYGWTFSYIPMASVVDNATYCTLSVMQSNAATANLADPDSNSMIWLSGTYRSA